MNYYEHSYHVTIDEWDKILDGKIKRQFGKDDSYNYEVVEQPSIEEMEANLVEWERRAAATNKRLNIIANIVVGVSCGVIGLIILSTIYFIFQAIFN